MQNPLNNLSNLQNENTAVSTINANNAKITAAIDNCLSRDGAAPNQMLAQIDMNSNSIINLPKALTNDMPIRKQEFDAALISASTVSDTILNLKANISSPAFVGTPTAPTPTSGDSSTKIATTAFVLNSLSATTAYATRTAAIAATIPGTVNYISVHGYYTEGDGGACNYVKSTAGAAVNKFQSADGAWWIMETPLNGEYSAAAFGVRAANADNGPILNNIFALFTDGAVIVLPAGNLLFSTPLNLVDKRNITLKGQGGLSAGATTATLLRFTGTGYVIAVNMKGAVGCNIEDIYFIYTSNLFTDTFIDVGKSVTQNNSLCSITRCNFGGAPRTAAFIKMRSTETLSVTKCNFFQGGPQGCILGKDVDSDFAVKITIAECHFVNCSNNPILNPDYSWTVSDCVFENLTSGIAGALACTSGCKYKVLNIFGSWCGDVTVSGGTWFDISGSALCFTGNELGSIGGGVITYGLNLTDCVGIQVTGNFFEGVSHGVAFVGSCANGNIQGNRFGSVTNPFSGLSNLQGYTASTSGYNFLPNAMILEYGVSTVTTGSPLVVAYPKALLTSPVSVQLTMSSPAGTTNSAYTSSVNQNNFTINVAGTAGSQTVYWNVIGTPATY